MWGGGSRKHKRKKCREGRGGGNGSLKSLLFKVCLGLQGLGVL